GAGARMVVEAGGGSIQGRVGRAGAYQSLGRFAEEADDLTEVLRVYPRSLDYLLRRSSAYQFAGRPDLATADIRAADALYRSGPRTLGSANNLAWRLVNGPPEARGPKRAMELLAESFPAGTENPVYLNTIGVVQYRNGQYQQAIATLEKSRGAGRGRYEGFDQLFLAMAHAKLGELGKARAAYAAAVDWIERQKHLNADLAAELAEFRAEAETVLRETGVLPRIAPPPRPE